MHHTRKTNSDPVNALLRGLIAVSLGAVLLAAALFLLIPRRSTGGSTLIQFPAETGPQTTQPRTPYGPEDFEYRGEYLACNAGSAVLGVDVSSHQGEIDWEQVRSAGMEFAIIRIGYRGYTSGGIYGDEYARANLEGARAAGLKVGVYFYSQALDEGEARREARYCLDFLDGEAIDLPVVFDWEYAGEDTRSGEMTHDALMACTRAFCQEVEDAGYRAMIYFNPHIAEDLLTLEELQEYPFWLAMYTDQMTWPWEVEMWQYTATGSVPGIQGDADINLWFVTESQ